jgi:hypothetical protein
MHAQPPHEFVAVGQDRCELMGGRKFFCGNRIVVRKIVLRGTGLFALLATDAEGRII